MITKLRHLLESKETFALYISDQKQWINSATVVEIYDNAVEISYQEVDKGDIVDYLDTVALKVITSITMIKGKARLK